VQPLRRVYGTLIFLARETVRMPQPGDTAPATFHVDIQDLAWRFIYTPIAGAVTIIAERLNYLQYLTIRRYLTLVFATLVLLLLVVAAWR
jgi:hypothetical protein